MSEVQILTTHTGSLARPPALTELLVRRDHGEDIPGLDAQVADAVKEIVRRQREVGLDIINDGESGKISYATYVTERIDGFGGKSGATPLSQAEAEEFPEFFARLDWDKTVERPACVAPLRHRGLDPIRADIANLQAALDETDANDAFVTAASPGVISEVLENQHYPTHEEYIWAIAEAMKPEYDAIHAAGLLLQLDCPDLTDRPNAAELVTHIEALNHATRDIPPERMRMHLCWGNFEGPHNHDIPLGEIIEPVLSARPAALSFEAANPRHAHEWRVFEEIDLPEGKTLIPGVIDSTTNYVEHPQLVADRIARYAELVGPERVVAGVDCGFATLAADFAVDPKIAWAKLRVLGEGAALAGRALSRASG
jgi:5-methyltetrahydropteroyltriglutamate--homocysteine methyltransferase